MAYPMIVGASGVAMSVVVCGIAIYIDQKVLRCVTPLRIGIASSLIAISAWTLTVIGIAHWIGVPGSYGPVQFWVGSSEADAFMRIRTLTLFLLVLGYPSAFATLVAIIIALFSKTGDSRWRCLAIPGAALLAFGLSTWVFASSHFYPSA